ncbi:MAG: hypothetical protein NVS1B4_26410 [Gemmatimonadaceae bacterium]
MGLDLVEYVLALESSFGIDIPNADAVRLETPRLLIDYLVSRLPVAPDAPDPVACRTQHAFYRARAAIAQRFAKDRCAVRPETELRALLGERVEEWRDLGEDLEARSWPRLYRDDWWASHLGGLRTLGELSKHLALYETSALREPDAPWTRDEIERIALQLLEHETGVEMSKFTLDSRFVRDMGLD